MMTTLTDDEMRVRIAEACGWEYTYGSASDEGFPWMSSDGRYHAKPPDYLNSLDAMAQAEKTLTEEQRRNYINLLAPPGYAIQQAVFASARQRALAFIETINQRKI